MTDINHVTIIGRLTKDPELKSTTANPCCNFSIANNKSFKKQGDTEYTNQVSYFNCTAWGKYPGEVIAKHYKKGDRIGIEGRIQQRSYEKDGMKHSIVEIIVENVQPLSEKHGDTKFEDCAEPEKMNSDGIPF